MLRRVAMSGHLELVNHAAERALRTVRHEGDGECPDDQPYGTELDDTPGADWLSDSRSQRVFDKSTGPL
jgi:hypothetical protein